MDEGARAVLPEGWQKPKGYSNGMIAEGRVLAVAGQIGWDEHERLVSREFLPQFARALQNVVRVVESAGGRAQNIVSVTLYVTDKREYLAELASIGATWRETVGRHYPAMALVQVVDLLEDGAKVEIQALAVLP